MNKYELLVILSAQVDDAEKEALAEKVKTICESKGATVESVDKWGVRKYAYPINYKNEGYYVLYNLEANAETPREIESVLNITDNVIRHMFVKR